MGTFLWKKNVYTKCIDLCTLFEKCVIDLTELCKFIENMYVECTKLGTLKSMYIECTYCVHSLKIM